MNIYNALAPFCYLIVGWILPPKMELWRYAVILIAMIVLGALSHFGAY